MPDYDEANKTELFEADPKYYLRSEADIVRVLRDLSKKPDIISAYFDGGQDYVLTAVLGVLPERGLVVLDYGPNDASNRRALNASRLVCVTKHDAVQVQFVCTGLKRAKYRGQIAFAAPLPESVYRPQRREFFRVHTPRINPVYLELSADERSMNLPLLDLSAGGLGLRDEHLELGVEVGDILKGCRFELPELGAVEVDLEVRNLHNYRDDDGAEIQRIGCAFQKLAPENNQLIQRYLHKLQLERKR